MRLPRHSLSVAALFALAQPALAQSRPESPAADPHREPAQELDRVTVTALPWQQAARDIVRPVEVLAGESLDDAKAATLGQTLQQLPGVQFGNFGPNVGRPVIRGLEGARVQVVSDGMGSGDLSSLSADHAISMDPFLADQIEVVKGPATLLYGTGAMGGAVSLTDGRSPHASGATPVSGRAEVRAGGADDARSVMFRVDGSTHPNGSGFVFHADGLHRESDDLRIPGFSESAALRAAEGEAPDPADRGVLHNSAARTASGALGVTWVGEDAHLGMSSSLFNTRYGVPGHSHAHEGEEGGGDVRISLQQKRHSLHGGFESTGVIRNSRFNFTDTRYTHTEYEGADIGTEFNNHVQELRAEFVHAPLMGWDGAFGVQAARRDFSARGDEALVPDTHGEDLGLFWLGKRNWQQLDLEAGARFDRHRVRAAAVPLLTTRDNERTFHTRNASVAARWHFRPNWDLGLSFDYAQRAPAAEELYANGPHAATGYYEIGNDQLKVETARRAELGLRYHGERFELHANAYQVDYDRFVHMARLMRADGVTPRTAHGMPVVVAAQSDARFRGIEFEANAVVFKQGERSVSLRGFGDLVHATLLGDAWQAAAPIEPHGDHVHVLRGGYSSAGNVPRLAAPRVGLGLKYDSFNWRASVNAIRTFRQDRVAYGERETPGYTQLDAHLAWHHDFDNGSGSGMELFIDGTNLLDAEIRQHTSWLKDVAPLGGRGVSAGVRLFF